MPHVGCCDHHYFYFSNSFGYMTCLHSCGWETITISNCAHHHHQNFVPTMMELATWIPFLHAGLSFIKSLDSLHFCISVLGIFIHVLSALSIFLDGPSTCIEKKLSHDVVAGVHWTCSNRLRGFSLNLSPIDVTHKYFWLCSFMIISFSSFTRHLFQHSHLCYTLILCTCCFLIGQQFA